MAGRTCKTKTHTVVLDRTRTAWAILDEARLSASRRAEMEIWGRRTQRTCGVSDRDPNVGKTTSGVRRQQKLRYRETRPYLSTHPTHTEGPA